MRKILLLCTGALLFAGAEELPMLYSEALRASNQGRYSEAKGIFLKLLKHPFRSDIPRNIFYDIELELSKAEVNMGQFELAKARLKQLKTFESELWIARAEYGEGHIEEALARLNHLKCMTPFALWSLDDRLFYIGVTLSYTSLHE